MLAEGEIYDSDLLKNQVNALIESGKRNLAIDLSPLDYIYSDSINVLLALNKRVLDSNGRLCVLGPQAEVRNILNRAGIQNILKIYESEAELISSSEEIIKQTQSISLADIRNYLKATPQSEFADLRSEISDAFGNDRPPVKPAGKPPVSKTPPPPAFKPKERVRPITPDVDSDELSFEPRSAQPKPAPNFEPRPQMADPRMRPRTDARPRSEAIPSFERPTQKVPVIPVTPPARKNQPTAEEWEETEEIESKSKSSPILIVLILVVVVAAIAVGGYFIFLRPLSQTESTEPMIAPVVVEVPVVTEPTTVPAIEVPTAAEQLPPVQQKPVPAAAPAPTRQAPAVQSQTPPPVRTPAPVERVVPAPRQAAVAEPAVPAGPRKLIINSTPSGATIKIEGKIMGMTPYTWNDPTVYGAITVVLAKNGYAEQAKSLDYTGGVLRENFILTKESVAPPPPQQPELEPEPAPAAAPARMAPAPAPVASEEPAPAFEQSRPAGEAATCFIASTPPVADVYLDGRLIGKTNLNKLTVSSGTHSMRFVKGDKEVTKDITFKPGDNPSQFVILK